MEQVTPVITKEPWQMTREEFLLAKRGKGSPEELEAAWHSAIYQANIAGKPVPPAITAQAEELARKVVIRPEPQAWELSWREWAHNRRIPYDSPHDKALAQKTHKGLVIEALSEGKPVPAEVRADYPDLAGQAGGAF